jgi:hypothetical protein
MKEQLWEAAKSELRGKRIAISPYINQRDLK